MFKCALSLLTSLGSQYKQVEFFNRTLPVHSLALNFPGITLNLSFSFFQAEQVSANEKAGDTWAE
jgi:hypothetical protein